MARAERLERLQMWLATSFGVGYAPVASGTFGSLPGLALYLGLYRLGGHGATAIGIVVTLLVGVWAASGAERQLGGKDPGPVVIDEVAGQMISLLLFAPTWQALTLGFVAFRVFDVLKPQPARRLERLPHGSGIMADDVVAGIYANLLLHGLNWAAPGLLGAA